MEGMEVITTLISQLGFPVAMCIILFYSLNQERKDKRLPWFKARLNVNLII